MDFVKIIQLARYLYSTNTMNVRDSALPWTELSDEIKGLWLDEAKFIIKFLEES